MTNRRGLGLWMCTSLVAGSMTGAETVFWGFLLLVAGIPVFAAMRWRAA